MGFRGMASSLELVELNNNSKVSWNLQRERQTIVPLLQWRQPLSLPEVAPENPG